MKPAPFKYATVSSVSEAISTLERYGSDARIIAGGQSLMQEMNLRQIRPAYLIDINPITELDYVRETPTSLAIGALTRHRTVERSELVRRVHPVLPEAVKNIAHFQIRTRGTIGGSLVQNSPGAEYGVVARLLDAEIVVVGSGGERVVPSEEFFVGHFQTSVRPGEMVTEVRFPFLPDGTGSAFLELTQRHGHLPIVSAAATVSLDTDGTVSEARLALGNVASGVPYRARAVDRLIGRELGPDVLEELAQAVSDEVQPDPEADMRAAFTEQLFGTQGRRTSEIAGAAYRKQVAGVLSRRAVEIASQRTEGGH
jgi:CO/xanthine dehydrogenase FAD-binding subunit